MEFIIADLVSELEYLAAEAYVVKMEARPKSLRLVQGL